MANLDVAYRQRRGVPAQGRAAKTAYRSLATARRARRRRIRTLLLETLVAAAATAALGAAILKILE